MSDRSASILYRRHGDRRSGRRAADRTRPTPSPLLNIAAAGHGDLRLDCDRLRAAPAPHPTRPAPPERRPATPGRPQELSPGPSHFVILAAALTGYIAFATFLINRRSISTVLAALLYLSGRLHRSGRRTEALLKPRGAGRGAPGDGRPGPQRARPARRRSARRRPAGGGGDRDRGGCSNRGACSRRTRFGALRAAWLGFSVGMSRFRCRR